MPISAARDWLWEATNDGLGASTRGRVEGLLQRVPRRHGIRVLTLHGVIRQESHLRIHRTFHTLKELRFIAHHLGKMHVLDPREMVEHKLPPERFGRPPVVLTVDDGYANNLLLADVFEEFRLPWSIFVSTGLVGSRRTVWTVELALLLLEGKSRNGSVEADGKGWPLGSTCEREAAHRTIRTPFKHMPAEARKQRFAELEAQFESGELERLMTEHPEFAMLTWPEVESLHGAGVVVGGHGVEHEVHNDRQPASVVDAECTGSATALRERLGTNPELCAYPDGQTNRHSARAAEAAGYRIGFTTQPGTVTSYAEPLLLDRLGCPNAEVDLARMLMWCM